MSTFNKQMFFVELNDGDKFKLSKHARKIYIKVPFYSGETQGGYKFKLNAETQTRPVGYYKYLKDTDIVFVE